jgi:hypothetical protein
MGRKEADLSRKGARAAALSKAIAVRSRQPLKRNIHEQSQPVTRTPRQAAFATRAFQGSNNTIWNSCLELPGTGDYKPLNSQSLKARSRMIHPFGFPSGPPVRLRSCSCAHSWRHWHAICSSTPEFPQRSSCIPGKPPHPARTRPAGLLAS